MSNPTDGDQGKKSPGLRDRKKAETRKRIAYATVELLVNEGAENTTIAQIAERADVSTRTFHNYFPHRESALLYMLNQFLDEMVDMVCSAEPGQELIQVAENIALNFFNRPAESPNSIESLSRLSDYLRSTSPQFREELFANNDRSFASTVEYFQPLVEAFQGYSRREGRELSRSNALLLINTVMFVPSIFVELRIAGEPIEETDLKNAFQLLAQGLTKLG